MVPVREYGRRLERYERVKARYIKGTPRPRAPLPRFNILLRRNRNCRPRVCGVRGDEKIRAEARRKFQAE